MSADLKTDCTSMDAELDRHFDEPDRPLSPQARQHLDECERCRKLYRYLAEKPPALSPELSPDLAPHVPGRIAEHLRKSLQPVSQLRGIPVLAAQLLIVFVVFAAAVTSMMKTIGLAAMSVGQLVGISAILALGVVLFSRSLAAQMTPGSMHRIPAWRAVAILGAGLVAGIVILFPWQTPQAFLERGLHCLRAGLMLAVPAAALFWWLVRRGAPLNLTTLGATLGATAGLLSVSVLQFTCNLQDIGHLLVWHVGVMVISTVAGALIGRAARRRP